MSPIYDLHEPDWHGAITQLCEIVTLSLDRCSGTWAGQRQLDSDREKMFGWHTNNLKDLKHEWTSNILPLFQCLQYFDVIGVQGSLKAHIKTAIFTFTSVHLSPISSSLTLLQKMYKRGRLWGGALYVALLVFMFMSNVRSLVLMFFVGMVWGGFQSFRGFRVIERGKVKGWFIEFFYCVCVFRGCNAFWLLGVEGFIFLYTTYSSFLYLVYRRFQNLLLLQHTDLLNSKFRSSHVHLFIVLLFLFPVVFLIMPHLFNMTYSVFFRFFFCHIYHLLKWD